jgi:nickel/cobalt transporter (NiCoT) family protein
MPELLTALPTDWSALCLLALLLGARHGLDADHLAAIDALTRIGNQAGCGHARWYGLLFAAGHGGVMLAAAATTAWARDVGALPGWLEASAALVSIALLWLLGVANLRGVLAAREGEMVRLAAGPRAWMAKLSATASPAAALGLGALFAVSVDTLSQATLFALAAAPLGGLAAALTLALLFTTGMACADGLNGLFLTRLLQRADAMAARVSRLLAAAVAALSLGVAAWALARWLAPAFEVLAQRWLQAPFTPVAQTTVVATIIAAVLISGALAARAASKTPAAA